MITYERVPGDIPAMTDELIAEHYPDLVECEARLGFLFARSDDPEAPAVKLYGYPCKATIKVNSYKDRVEGKPDATITIDGDGWTQWTHEERLAVLDHELYHLEVRRDDEGHVKADDHGRPKLGIKLHDIVIGGFAAIARRHGEHAAEVQQARQVQDDYGQLLFAWAEGPKGREFALAAGK